MPQQRAGGDFMNVNEIDEQLQQAATIPTQVVESVWMVGNVEVQDKEEEELTKVYKRRRGRKEEKKQQATEVCAIDGQALTREAAMEFNEADVLKPLASAACVAKAGNGMWLDENGEYIQNIQTGERMMIKIENGTYVFDVKLDDGDVAKVTLDSGAGCNVWPRGRSAGASEMMPKKSGVNMVAANGTHIGHYGQKQVRFRGIRTKPGFSGRM